MRHPVECQYGDGVAGWGNLFGEEDRNVTFGK